MPHENAVPEVVTHTESLRAKAKLCKFNEKAKLALQRVQRRLSDRMIMPILDSSAKWDSTFNALERDYDMRRTLEDMAASYPSTSRLRRALKPS